MPTEIERFQELKTKKEQYERKLIEAETKQKSAEEQVEKSLVELKEKFGFGSLEEAKKALAEWKVTLGQALVELDSALKMYESGDIKEIEITGV